MNKKQIASYPLIVMETLRKHKVMFFVCLFFFMLIILSLLDYFTSESFKDSFWGGVLVEAHGMFLDIILFGILLTLYERFTEQKNEIDRLNEEIDYYRGWNEPEAMYRIVGCIKRLNRKGIHEIDLRYCFLRGANLKDLNLNQSNLSWADLTNANLEGSSLIRTSCRYTNFENANLVGVDLSCSILGYANFLNANLLNAKIEASTFEETIMINAILINPEADLFDISDSHLELKNTFMCNNFILSAIFSLSLGKNTIKKLLRLKDWDDVDRNIEFIEQNNSIILRERLKVQGRPDYGIGKIW